MASAEDDRSSSSKRSVLGPEQAKRRLQAFRIQKKLTSVAGCAGAAFSAASKRDAAKPTPSGEADKSKASPKKSNGKEMNPYESRRAAFMNMVELKKEEETKLALVRLGVPLGMVPGNAVVKGLTTKPMPTKAMPPVKNFLDPEEIESLIDRAKSGNLNIDFKIPAADSQKRGAYRKKSDRFDGRGRQNRFSKDRRSEDSRKYRNGRDRRGDEYDSRSRSRNRNYGGEREKSSGSSGSVRSKSDNDKSGPSTGRVSKSKVGDYVIASLYGSNALEYPSVDKTKSEVSKKSNAIGSAVPAATKDDSFIDMLSFDIEDKKDSETAENDAIYSKFIPNTFVPLPSVNNHEMSDKDIIDENNSNGDLIADIFVKKNYSPRKVSNRSGNPEPDKSSIATDSQEVFCNYIFGGEELSKFSLEPDKKDEFHENDTDTMMTNFSSEKGDNISGNTQNEFWNDLLKICKPTKHTLSDCYRTTSSLPPLSFSENYKYCKCATGKTNNLEKLLSNVYQIRDQFCNLQIQEGAENFRNWYTNIAEALKDASFEFASNWESDDSPLQKSQYSIDKDSKSPVFIPRSDSDSLSKLSISAIKLPSPNIPTNFKLQLSDEIIEKTGALDKNLPTTKNTSDIPSLDLEYEKFMEAVWPEIANNSKENSPKCDVKLDGLVSSEKTVESFTPPDTEANKDFNLWNLDDNSVNTQSIDFIENFDDKKSKCDIEKSEVTKDNSNDGQWSSSSDFETMKKIEKQLTPPSPKPSQTRKGHAKISSRRNKGKHKKSSKTKMYSPKSENSSSSTSEDSSSSSSDSSSDITIPEDDNSLSSSNGSSSSSTDTTSSSSDSSSTNSSESSDDEVIKKKRTKQLLKKKKTHKLSKSKRKILAKAKEIAKKMSLKRKKKKLKEKIAKEKQQKQCNDESKTHEGSDKIDVKTIKRKLHNKDSPNKIKQKTVSPDRSSDTSSDSSLSIAKRRHDNSDYSSDSEENVCKKKTKLSEKITDIGEGLFNIETVINIKKEKLSDEEELLGGKKAESSIRNNANSFRQEIINATELQNDFLQGTNVGVVANIIIKTEKIPSKDNYNEFKLNDTDYSPNTRVENDYIKFDESHQKTSLENKNILKRNWKDEINCFSNEASEIEGSNWDWKSEDSADGKERNSHYDGPNSKSTHKTDDSVSREIPIESVDRLHENGYVDTKLECQIRQENDYEYHNANNSSFQTDTSQSESSMIYKIPTIDFRSSQFESDYNHDENYEMDYDVYSKHNTEPETIRVANFSSRKISLDDRINLVLQYPGEETSNARNESPDEGSSQNVKPNAHPEKSILISGNSKSVRADPRINRAKRVSFADGLAPGQDSDCETDVGVEDEKEDRVAGDKKRRRSCGGHAYPCPESWPDYHPRWDKLPPPPPPPGSPPPDLYEAPDPTFFPREAPPTANVENIMVS